ncbi:DNA-binding response regulator [Oscillospiraceae bacterium]|nr:DNA-binding response regulator [Oscillospiraceae bacterium]BDF76700.1 DNA-binding response regulator [Oscillospiraceae bacterium]
MAGTKILFADDDPEIREVIRLLLSSEGYEVIEAADGDEAVNKMEPSIDLVILDVMMPGRSGIAACAEIRRVSTAPILFLTAKSQDSDKAVGFSAGGDDYMAKPFSYAELTARVKAMLRRYRVYRGKGETAAAADAITLPGGLTIRTDRNEVVLGGAPVALTDLEYRILLLLARNRRQTFSAQQIYERIWQEPYYYSANNTVMVHIRNLRKKLEDDANHPHLIKNIWGKGYCIE